MTDTVSNRAHAVILAVLVIAVTVSVLVHRPSTPAWAPAGYAACELEDSPGPCYWNADTMGNGTGTSFYVDAAGTYTYPGGTP